MPLYKQNNAAELAQSAMSGATQAMAAQTKETGTRTEKQVRDDKLDDLTALALKTFDTGDPAGRKEMLKDLKDWNSRMKEEGKPNMLIAPKEVIRRVKARRRENRPTPKNLREKARLQASWN